MPDTIPFELKAGAEVRYFPSAALPGGPMGVLVAPADGSSMLATVTSVYNAHVVDLLVTDVEGGAHPVRFCPFLRDGDPDPLSRVGRCQEREDRVEKDYTEDHEIMESKRPARGESIESFNSRTAAP